MSNRILIDTEVSWTIMSLHVVPAELFAYREAAKEMVWKKPGVTKKMGSMKVTWGFCRKNGHAEEDFWKQK